jgi:Fungal specific transcription factor domain
MAHVLRLNEANSDDKFTVAETKRRVWWTLFMADRWCSSGLGLPRQINDKRVQTALPMNEQIFHQLDPEQNALSTRWQPGFWAFMIKFAEIFGAVQDFHQRLVEGLLDDEAVERTVEDMAQQLDYWKEALPVEMQLNESNLERWQQRGHGSTFVALQLGYHHYSTLIYFHYLDTTLPVTERSQIYADRCRHHAAAFSSLIRLSREKPNCEAVYATVGHMTVVSSSVMLHTLIFGNENELLVARENLSSNFAALVELKKYWPSLEKWVSVSPLLIARG